MTTKIIPGRRVIRGGRGAKGLSAYQAAVAAGFEGTEEEYVSRPLDSAEAADEVRVATEQVRQATLTAKGQTEAATTAAQNKTAQTEAVRAATDGVRVATDQVRQDTLAVKGQAQAVVDASPALMAAKDAAVAAKGGAETARDAAAVSAIAAAAALTSRASGERGKNLVNPADPDVALGFFPVHTTGLLSANVNYNTTGFIPVTAGLSYTASQKHYWCWYNAAKVFISGTSDANGNKTQVAPAGAAFMRCSFSVGGAPAPWSIAQVELGAVQTAYEAYSSIVKVATGALKDGDTTTSKLAAKAVTPAKVDFLQPGKNLFNKATARIGYYLDHGSGSESVSATYDYSDYIEVVEGQTYHGSGATQGMRFITPYTAGKAVAAGGVEDAGAGVLNYVIPAGVRYVRVTIWHNNLNSFQFELGSAATPYAAYGYLLAGAGGEQIAAPPTADSVGTAALIAGSVTPAKTSFLLPGKNLFDKAAALPGFMSPGGGVTAHANYSYSDFIPVVEGQTYKGAGAGAPMRFTTYFNFAKGVVAGGSMDDTTGFTVPAGVAYVRVTVYNSVIDSFQFEVGSVATGYEAYGYKTSFNLIGVGASTVSKWSAKTWGLISDSIGAGNTWPPYVSAALGLVFTNYSAGGTKISGAGGDATAMCQDTRINAVATTHDLVTLMGGTNDWAQNVVLGSATSTDPTTFNGALNVFAAKAYARWPLKRIMLATTPYGEIPDYVPRGWADPAHNTLGLTTNDYAEAMRRAGERLNLGVIDVARDAGWGHYNISPALGGSVVDLLHPAAGSLAAKGIASVYNGRLKAVEPMS